MRSRFSHKRAHVNSILRIVRPTGMTTIAGPGVTIMTMPIISTVAPTTPTTIRRPVLYVKCTALLINTYPNTLYLAALCRGFSTTRTNTGCRIATRRELNAVDGQVNIQELERSPPCIGSGILIVIGARRVRERVANAGINVYFVRLA